MAYERIQEQGFTFLFKIHPGTDMLHIYVRHLTSPEDAFAVFFDESLSDEWNAEYGRYEMRSRSHILTFNVLPDGNILIISCMRIEP